MRRALGLAGKLTLHYTHLTRSHSPPSPSKHSISNPARQTTPVEDRQFITTTMKRKLNENDQPTPVAVAAETEAQLEPANASTEVDSVFPDFGLDSRLLQSVTHQKWRTPTLVQSKAMPLIMDGSDVLAKAKTGSGKTAAYLLPILHAILKKKQVRFTPLRVPLRQKWEC